MIGKCKLCLSENIELRNSHIIPEFMYQNLYDKNPKRFFVLKIQETEKSKKIEQKGIREKILCDSCENKFSKFEGYAAKTIYAKNFDNEVILKFAEQNPEETSFLYHYENFDYTLFKLFLMSLLWRFLVSEKYETPYAGSHTENLRLALLDKNPLRDYQYGCLIQSILYKKGNLAKGFILNPYHTQIGDINFLHILIDGFLYSFCINANNTLSSDITDFFLKETGEMKILGRLVFEDDVLLNKINTAYEYFKVK
jgi:hypothetical protein